MNIAIVGCGFVADFYVQTLKNYPSLRLVGAFDRDAERARVFSEFHKAPLYPSLESLLADDKVGIVANLTNPRSHYEVTKAALRAGKHVYTEKPLATEMDDAVELHQLAQKNNLHLSSAPCNLLGETAQTLWKALVEGKIGTPRLAYASMDDGMLHRMNYHRWRVPSGAAWPWKDEFEIGCTLEHAGYYLSWFPAFFGPAVSVTAMSDCLFPDKMTDQPLDPPDAPDFSVAIVKFASGFVLRLSTTNAAPHDHALQIIGDEGILQINDSWKYDDPVYLRRWFTFMGKRMERPLKTRIPAVRKSGFNYPLKASHRMDFARGIHDMAGAIGENRSPVLSADYCLHINEMVLAIQNAGPGGRAHAMKTTFEPIPAMAWAGNHRSPIKQFS